MKQIDSILCRSEIMKPYDKK